MWVMEPRSAFFREVVYPMAKAHALYKSGDIYRARKVTKGSTNDWLRAGDDWLQRRESARIAKGQV